MTTTNIQINALPVGAPYLDAAPGEAVTLFDSNNSPVPASRTWSIRTWPGPLASKPPVSGTPTARTATFTTPTASGGWAGDGGYLVQLVRVESNGTTNTQFAIVGVPDADGDIIPPAGAAGDLFNVTGSGSVDAPTVAMDHGYMGTASGASPTDILLDSYLRHAKAKALVGFTVSAPLVLGGSNVSIPLADATHDGYMSQTLAALVLGATASATVSTIAKRDGAGLLFAVGYVGNSLDRAGAGALPIGGGHATSITVGSASIPTASIDIDATTVKIGDNAAGTISIGNNAAPSAMTIFGTVAVNLLTASQAVVTNVAKQLTSLGYDSNVSNSTLVQRTPTGAVQGSFMLVPPAGRYDVNAAGALNIATTSATSVTIGQAGVNVTVPGALIASTSINVHSNLQANATGVGFNGAAPVAQPARVGQLTDSTGGSVTSTLAAITAGAAYAQADMVAVKNALASLAAKVNASETVDHNVGLTA